MEELVLGKLFARTSYLINSSAIVINVIYSVEKSKGESGSSVDIGMGHGVESPRIEFRWEKGFPLFQNGSEAHPASCSMGTWSLKEVRRGRGVELNNPPQLGRKILEKNFDITLLKLMAFVDFVMGGKRTNSAMGWNVTYIVWKSKGRI